MKSSDEERKNNVGISLRINDNVKNQWMSPCSALCTGFATVNVPRQWIIGWFRVPTLMITMHLVCKMLHTNGFARIFQMLMTFNGNTLLPSKVPSVLCHWMSTMLWFACSSSISRSLHFPHPNIPLYIAFKLESTVSLKPFKLRIKL